MNGFEELLQEITPLLPLYLNGLQICSDGLPRRVFGKDDEYSQPAIVCQPTLYTSISNGKPQRVVAEYLTLAANLLPEFVETLAACYNELKEAERLLEFEGIGKPAESLVPARELLDKLKNFCEGGLI